MDLFVISVSFLLGSSFAGILCQFITPLAGKTVVNDVVTG